MKRDEIIKRLKEREADLRAHGVTHAALFGSVARGEQRPDSDIDILVDLDPAIVTSIPHSLFLAGDYTSAIPSYGRRARYYLDAAAWLCLIGFRARRTLRSRPTSSLASLLAIAVDGVSVAAPVGVAFAT